jgi:large subunit ribosomal protein L3
MGKYIIGRKLGMTQVFGDKGVVIPVTVVEAGPCVITQIKDKSTDGYTAVQIAFENIRKNLVNKPRAGVFKKANTAPKRILREFRIENAENLKVGDTITCETFAVGDIVDVTSKTKGRGFTGVIKRWNQHRVGSMSHGTGPIHRSVGSMSAHTEPSRVFKNKHMAGQYGVEQVTIQNLSVVKIDAAKNCLFIKGGIPGPDGALVSVKTAVKTQKVKKAGAK